LGIATVALMNLRFQKSSERSFFFMTTGSYT
jgi:hypothetical protein